MGFISDMVFEHQLEMSQERALSAPLLFIEAHPNNPTLDSPLVMPNLLADIPSQILNEQFEEIVSKPGIRIERILSNGHTTENGKWYDQTQDEWVLILKGAGSIEYPDGRIDHLQAGDHLRIPAGTKHRVAHTEKPTVWLAIHFD